MRMSTIGTSFIPVPARVTRRAGRPESIALLGTPPRAASRGVAPLIAAAVAAGALRTGWGILSGHKRADQRRSRIYDEYTRGRARLDVHQYDVRQGELGSLSQRGLTGGGGITDTGAVGPTPVWYGGKQGFGDTSPIKAAMTFTKGDTGVPDQAPPGQSAAPAQPHTLGQQQVADLGHEQLLEQNDMLATRDNAINDASAEATQGAIDSIGAGINTATSVYGMGKEFGAATAPAASKASPIQSAMSVQNPSNWWGGINGVDPLSAPGSSWNLGGGRIRGAMGRTTIGAGQPNYDFQEGN